MIEDFIKASQIEEKPVGDAFLERWAASNKRSRKEIEEHPEICPYASIIQFPADDKVRYCLFRVTGGTCQSFREPKWETCPTLAMRRRC